MIAAAGPPVRHREDDQLLINQAIQSLDITDSIQVFYNGQEALDYLETTQQQPFLILPRRRTG